MNNFCMYTSMYIYEKHTSIHRCTCESLYKRTTICVCIFECYLNLQMLYNLQMYVIYLYGLHEENHLGLLLQEIIIIVEPETRDVSFHVHMNHCTYGQCICMYNISCTYKSFFNKGYFSNFNFIFPKINQGFLQFFSMAACHYCHLNHLFFFFLPIIPLNMYNII